jgi:ribosome-associated protein
LPPAGIRVTLGAAVPLPIVVDPRVLVPADAVHVAVARASGPGGQNVNKVSSKVDVRVDLGAVVGLDPAALARLRALARTRLDAEGMLHVTSQRTRDKERNLEDAYEKIRALVAAALIAPVARRPTRPSRGAVRRRVEDKRRTGARKQARAGRGDD